VLRAPGTRSVAIFPKWYRTASVSKKVNAYCVFAMRAVLLTIRSNTDIPFISVRHNGKSLFVFFESNLPDARTSMLIVRVLVLA
jgi:hypothetical protein